MKRKMEMCVYTWALPESVKLNVAARLLGRLSATCVFLVNMLVITARYKVKETTV